MYFLADSHDLAHGETEVNGIVKSNQEVGTKDVGWHKPVAYIPDPLIATLPNGRLWSLIRRFNKVRDS